VADHDGDHDQGFLDALTDGFGAEGGRGQAAQDFDEALGDQAQRRSAFDM